MRVGPCLRRARPSARPLECRGDDGPSDVLRVRGAQTGAASSSPRPAARGRRVGQRNAPPILLAHGGFDFAGTFDVFAPLLAAGGWRVVAWDQRGHGDSDHAELYAWDADVRDALRGARHRHPGAGARSSVTPRAAAISCSWPRPCRSGARTWSTSTGSRPGGRGPTSRARASRILANELAAWLEHRARRRDQGAAGRHARGPGRAPPADEPPARSGLAAVPRDRSAPATTTTAGAGRSTLAATSAASGRGDPSGPCSGSAPGHAVPRPASGWRTSRWAGAPSPRTCCPSPPARRLEVFDDAGHFLHIEQPRQRGRPGARLPRPAPAAHRAAPTARRSSSSRPMSGSGSIAWPTATATAVRCCCSTVSASGRRAPCPTGSTQWPGPVLALDFTGHGDFEPVERRRLHGRDVAGRRRHGPRGTRPGHRVRPRASAPTSPC